MRIMGYIAHDAVLVSTAEYRAGGLPDVEAFRQSLPEPWRRLVIGPIEAVANFGVFYAFLPDGSKEGWDTSDEGDRYRSQFVALFATAYEDGSSTDDVISVRFGEDFRNDVGSQVTIIWPPGDLEHRV